MKKLTDYELEILDTTKLEMDLLDKILISIFKRFSYKVYQVGFKSRYFK